MYKELICTFQANVGADPPRLYNQLGYVNSIVMVSVTRETMMVVLDPCAVLPIKSDGTTDGAPDGNVNIALLSFQNVSQIVL